VRSLKQWQLIVLSAKELWEDPSKKRIRAIKKRVVFINDKFMGLKVLFCFIPLFLF
jgi:hypothetical protein